MDRKSAATLMRERDAETTEELIGILTAISLVSKRLAKKLTLLKRQSAGNGGVRTDGRTTVAATHAD